MSKFYIYCWSGRRLDTHGSFKTFEDAWDYILGEMTDDLNLTEEDYQEYDVREAL